MFGFRSKQTNTEIKGLRVGNRMLVKEVAALREQRDESNRTLYHVSKDLEMYQKAYRHIKEAAEDAGLIITEIPFQVQPK